MGTITEIKNKDGTVTYKGYIRCKGISLTKNFKTTLGRKNFRDTEKQAQNWIDETEEKIKNGTYRQEHKQHYYTIKEAITKYIQDGYPHNVSVKYKNSTITSLNWWKSEIGTIPLKSLTRSDIVQCINKLKTKPCETHMRNQNNKISKTRIISDSTIKSYLAHLSKFLSVCFYDYEILEHNIMLNAKFNVAKSTSRKRFFDTTEERNKLLKCMAEQSYQAYLGTLIMMLTGSRTEEMAKLTWRTIDLENRTIRFNETKNGTDRTIAMPDVLFNELTAYKQQCKIRNINNNDLLFSDSRGQINTHLFYKKCNRIIAENGFNENVDEKGRAIMYSLRHTFTSIAGLCGISVDIVDKITGHLAGRGSVTTNYTHISAVGDDMRIIMNKIANYILFGPDTNNNNKYEYRLYKKQTT